VSDLKGKHGVVKGCLEGRSLVLGGDSQRRSREVVLRHFGGWKFLPRGYHGPSLGVVRVAIPLWRQAPECGLKTTLKEQRYGAAYPWRTAST